MTARRWPSNLRHDCAPVGVVDPLSREQLILHGAQARRIELRSKHENATRRFLNTVWSELVSEGHSLGPATLSEIQTEREKFLEDNNWEEIWPTATSADVLGFFLISFCQDFPDQLGADIGRLIGERTLVHHFRNLRK